MNTSFLTGFMLAALVCWTLVTVLHEDGLLDRASADAMASGAIRLVDSWEPK